MFRTEKAGLNHGSVIAKTKNGFAVRIVFVQNCNKRSEWLAVLSTDTTLCVEVSDMYLKTALAQPMASFTQLKKQFSLDTDFIFEQVMY
ncbi:hypothetical protein F7731_12800 [Cytobacillus depressus]|uniref:Uncharacterized protein n=1 Tax=Cytobacillus depressus TaxID=1602942 RepID=A0A6L3V5T6_9BACI|nr:hypothetical protein F7731_12800 [Cytobacillus depressus]